MKKFEFNSLYNSIKIATSLEGYRHKDEAKQRMVKRFENKIKHPFLGNHQDGKIKRLISKPGSLNPMFGETHSEKTKDIMGTKKVKYPNGVGLYGLYNNLIKNFSYAPDLAKYLDVSKVTVCKYINKGLVYKEKYYLKINMF
jgi:group I intron endonuclease